MSRLNIIRAWEDPEFRLRLTQTEPAQLPAHPAELIELTDRQLAAEGGVSVAGIVWGIVEGIAGNYLYGCMTGSGLCSWMSDTSDTGNPNLEGM
jgi:mersacidin/lichenicidin family type 2 lantibiotic